MENNLVITINELYLLKNKKIDCICNKILKKMSFKSSKDLSNLKELCYWLYIYGYTTELKNLYSVIFSLSFVGNWDIWVPVESILALIYYITSNEINAQSDAQVALKKIMQAEVSNTDIAKRCDGSLLKEYEDKVQQYTAIGKKTILKNWLCYEMEELLLIYALGVSDKYPLKIIEKKVEDIKKQLQMM